MAVGDSALISLSRCVFVSEHGHVFQLKDMPLTPHAQSLRLVMTVCGLYLCVLYLAFFGLLFLHCFLYLPLPQCVPRPDSHNAMRWDGGVDTI
jgi:hypothetical protein